MKATFDLPELARMTGVSVPRMARMLNSAKVPIRGGGRKGVTRYVLLADLRRMDPDLWDSIRLASSEQGDRPA